MLASPIHTRMKNGWGKQPWDYISHRWDRATKAAGCPDVTLHILRHTCASRLVQKGIPIYTVSKWLGHSSVKVTERYAKLAPDSLAGALAALEST
jgi:integrase